MKSWIPVGMVLLGVALNPVAVERARAQASTIPSAQAGSETQPASGELSDKVSSKGRKLMNEMVMALGGDAWVNRRDWIFYGRMASFYKGQPEAGAPQFEDYCRAEPFGERVVMIAHYGVVFGSDHRDVADVWTTDHGSEITYKGSHALAAKVVEEYERRRRHSLDVIVQEWLKQPGVLVTYEGTKMVERHLAEQVSILSTSNDAVVVELEQSTHLPLSLNFLWRDPLYKDWNTDAEEFADYHEIQGIMTPYSVTTLHNGDTTEQRFLTKVVYNVDLPTDLFDPNRLLQKKAK